MSRPERGAGCYGWRYSWTECAANSLEKEKGVGVCSRVHEIKGRKVKPRGGSLIFLAASCALSHGPKQRGFGDLSGLEPTPVQSFAFETKQPGESLSSRRRVSSMIAKEVRGAHFRKLFAKILDWLAPPATFSPTNNGCGDAMGIVEKFAKVAGQVRTDFS